MKYIHVLSNLIGQNLQAMVQEIHLLLSNLIGQNFQAMVQTNLEQCIFSLSKKKHGWLMSKISCNCHL